MQFTELEQQAGGLPCTAGVAELNWFDPRGKGDVYLRRDGPIISIPKSNELDFFSLLGGKQFVVEIERTWGTTVYFGGTDEAPFLVHLKDEWAISRQGSEERFFASLKPEGLKRAEKCFGTVPERQGDWFALPIPIPYEHIREILRVGYSSGRTYLDPDTNSVRKYWFPLGRTRHRLGTARPVIFFEHSVEYSYAADAVAVVNGAIITAPDHKTLTLKGPHVLYQTAGLVDPQRVD